MNRKPELLAPAGDWSALTAAVQAGADAIYFGVDRFNMRHRAKNFTRKELPEITAFCREAGVQTHLTLNTIVYEDELPYVTEVVEEAKRAQVDMIICMDLAVMEVCRALEMPFCVSTQASVSNSAAACFYQRLGAERVVLARECTLDMIRDIREKTTVGIEAFIHGAMCIAVSGRCFLSHYLYGKSGNRGECNQPCRREFFIQDNDDRGNQLILGEDYVMSPRDLCTMGFIDQLIDAGIDSFKIEGRMRNPEYVRCVVSCYRRAIDACFSGCWTRALADSLTEELKTVFNRGFSTGFYFGAPGVDDFARQYGNQATTKKEFVGKVLNHFRKAGVVHVRLEGSGLEKGDQVRIIGPTTGVVNCTVSTLRCDEKDTALVSKGETVTFPCNEKVRMSDQVYRILPVTPPSTSRK